jgi:hypothetical protein
MGPLKLNPASRFVLASLLIPGAAALGHTHIEAGSGVTAGLLSIWKANITPTKEEAFMVLYHVLQGLTILSLILYAGCSTLRRSNSMQQIFVLSSLICGVAMTAWYPGRRFEACLEGCVALGFFTMGYVFDNAASWWTAFWNLLDRIRPGRRTAILPQ